MANSFNTSTKLVLGDKEYVIHSLQELAKQYPQINTLPFSIKILLENLLRTEDDLSVNKKDIEKIINVDLKKEQTDEIAFTPARVILQDFTGVPAIVDLASMREAMQDLKGSPDKINPLSPVDLVIDHSVIVDNFASKDALQNNTDLEFERNKERYNFLRWGQKSFSNFKVVPPGTGIVHQVNLEYLAKVAFIKQEAGYESCYPDTLVGTDSHTTMINGLGVLGWGVGGIEAEAAMLGQPVTMLIPEVIGFKLIGQLQPGTTATDLVLTVVQMLRKKGVVGKFVEFYGNGLDNLPLADRATIGNMAPEYGATCGIFPVDKETIKYLMLSGRDEQLIKIVESYYKHQGMFRETNTPDPIYTDTLELDLSSVVPCIAGPKRPQDKINLIDAKNTCSKILTEQNVKLEIKANIESNDKKFSLTHGDVVIAAITSCTNTSNPDVMIAAGLVAKKASMLGLRSKPWVKTSLAPGSKVVTDYLQKAYLYQYLETLGFNLVGYGCTTCIGNSGPLPDPINSAITDNNLMVSAVLSGNRNFEGRIHPLVKNAYLASPPLVVVYALAGTMNIDLLNEPIGVSFNGTPVFMKDIWPTPAEIQEIVTKTIDQNMFKSQYSAVFDGDKNWQQLSAISSNLFAWDNNSTYIRKPTFFDGITKELPSMKNINKAYVLVKLEDSVTTDHISPAGSFSDKTPAGKYLIEHGVTKQDFNSYGSRRGNHEVMVRGTFANVRLKNLLAKDTEGGVTIHFPTNQTTSIYEASMLYQQANNDLIIIAGKEYGSGSSRDWAAKGTRLLGVKAVLVESFERIHRSNLIGMGILPLQFKAGENSTTLGLDGTERFDISLENIKPLGTIQVTAYKNDILHKQFEMLIRIDTPKELEYFVNGGILHYVLRQLAK